MSNTIESECLQRLEPLFTHLTPNPATIDEGTTSCTKIIVCDADATYIELAFPDDEMNFAGFQCCLGLGEFAIMAERSFRN